MPPHAPSRKRRHLAEERLLEVPLVAAFLEMTYAVDVIYHAYHHLLAGIEYGIQNEAVEVEE